MPTRSSRHDADKVWIPLFTVLLVAMVMLVLLMLAGPSASRPAGTRLPSPAVAVSWGNGPLGGQA